MLFTPAIFMPTASAAVTLETSTLSAHKAILSNGNLTATNDGSATDCLAFATNSVSGSQKIYFEYTFLNGPGTNAGVGLQDNNTALSGGFIGGDTHSIAFYPSGGWLYNGANPSGGSGWSGGADGDVVSFAIDFGNAKLFTRINGGSWDTGADPASNTGGVAMSVAGSPLYVVVDCRSVTNSQLNMKFASASWTYSAPSGFTHL